MIDTAAFYRESCEKGFIQLEAIARNVRWVSSTAWGDMEITINLSKPEKDPAAIAAAAGAASGGAPTPHAPGQPAPVPAAAPALGSIVGDNPAIRSGACQLCVTDRDVQLGYARRLQLGGEPWGLWYSPYAYFNQHCIAMCWQHRPMHIDRAAFACLFDFVDEVPQYFIGSNADLPIVGGSILAHDHFQGGNHVFPLQKAPVCQEFSLPDAPEVKAGVVKWPVTVLRLESPHREALLRAACHILRVWRGYDDDEAGIVARTGATPHNTLTPMLRRVRENYVFDLALRCNITSAEHPLGVFHPHARLHHIKRENIGLIEVMGLAILPPRVREVMRVRGLSQNEVGALFAEVLECTGVFKWDAPGRNALARFLQALQAT